MRSLECASLSKSRQHNIFRTLIQIWIAACEARKFDEEIDQGELLERYEMRVGAGEQGG